MGTKITFEKDTCHRCIGTGRLAAYSHVHGGVCFKCNGSGSLYTPASRKAKAIVDEVIVQRTKIAVTDVVVGQLIRPRPAQPKARVIAIGEDRENGAAIVDGVRIPMIFRTLTLQYADKVVTYSAELRFPLYRETTSEDVEAAITALGRRKAGFKVTRD